MLLHHHILLLLYSLPTILALPIPNSNPDIPCTTQHTARSTIIKEKSQNQINNVVQTPPQTHPPTLPNTNTNTWPKRLYGTFIPKNNAVPESVPGARPQCSSLRGDSGFNRDREKAASFAAYAMMQLLHDGGRLLGPVVILSVLLVLAVVAVGFVEMVSSVLGVELDDDESDGVREDEHGNYLEGIGSLDLGGVKKEG
ncbi:hypothetical protein BBP40_000027 [Aspergillus hancockii]|nr:hypothetical protein BBP40_000027 [Aspergillus hancockii]